MEIKEIKSYTLLRSILPMRKFIHRRSLKPITVKSFYKYVLEGLFKDSGKNY